MNPEEIAIQVLNSQGIPLGNALEQRLAIAIADALRDYGAACAAEMRERAKQVAGEWEESDGSPTHRYIAAAIAVLPIEP